MSVIYRLKNKSYKIIKGIATFVRVAFVRRPAVFLFGCPIHSNLGDQAQLMCIERWARGNFPNHALIGLNYSMSTPLMLDLIKRVIKDQDVILFHSGYLMVDHHGELPVLCRVVSSFPRHRILIFPQTINLQREEVRNKVMEAINGHSDVILMCRDEVSYGSAREMFGGSTLLLYPDVVTSLIGARSYEGTREGVMFCMRNDKEAYYTPQDIEGLRDRLAQVTTCELTDTSVSLSRFEMERCREEVIEGFIERMSKFEVVITDRYHGTIFSLIAATPVIVLSSADHKLVSGVKWFPDSFSEHVYFASDLDQAYEIAERVVGGGARHSLPPYFEEKYYSNLWERVEAAHASEGGAG